MSELVNWAVKSAGSAVVGWAAVALMAISGAIGAVLGQLKTRAEIKNLKAQIVESEGKLLLSVQESRKKYSEATNRCGRLAAKLGDLIRAQASVVDLHAAREELSECLTHEVVPSYLVEREWVHLKLKGADSSPDGFDELLEDASEEMRRFRRWLTTINHPKFLKAMNKEPLQFQYRTFRPFLNMVEGFPADIRNERMRKAKQIVADITAPQQKQVSS